MDMTNIERFMSKVYPEPNTGCYLFIGSTKRNGYGQLLSKSYNGFNLAHRFAYYLEYGEFDRSMNVCHKCDNPICVNPDHLFLGTQFENCKDMTEKGRRVRGEGFKSAKLNDESVIKIRQLYATGNFLQKEIAKMFSVGKTSIVYILSRKTWNHV